MFKQLVSVSSSLVLIASSLYGDTWSSEQNEHGFVLKSSNKTLYLGKDCDAISPQYGNGEWYWNGSDGVSVILDKKDFSFNTGSLYDDGRCEKQKSSSSTGENDSSSSSSDDGTAALIIGGLVVAGLAALFSGDDEDSSSSSSDYSSSSSSSSSYKPCYSDDKDCYKITETKFNGTVYIIECTKGNVGWTNSICSDDDGDWSSGCTLGSYHYQSLEEAANRFCR